MTNAELEAVTPADGLGLENITGELTSLLHPMEVGFFFKEYWDRKALFLPGHPKKFAGLFDRAAFYRGLPHCIDLKVGYTDEKGWPAHFNIKPHQVQDMLDSGKTVCASAIDTQNPDLTSFLKEVGRQFALLGRFFFNSYLSPDGAGFGLHLDHHPVMILQIEGRKRWWYSPEPALREVLSNISFPHGRDALQLPWVTVTRPPEASLCEVVLNPGDLLYMPKGTWHRAQAIGGSLGLTLAMESASPLDLLQHALAPHLNRIELRNALPGYWAQSIEDGMPAELEAAFDSALSSLRTAMSSITSEKLFSLWRQAQNAQNGVKK
jgi:ribosomal protein L16 Arg81 hydroxylase